MSKDFAALIDAARLREAIKYLRCSAYDRADFDTVIAAAEAYLATLPPPPRDTVIVCFPPEGDEDHKHPVLLANCTMYEHGDAVRVAENQQSVHGGWRYVVVRRAE